MARGAGRPGLRAAALGADRVIAPAGALPQAAERLDATPPCRPHELEIAVELLNLDATSHRQLATAAGGEARRMADDIAAIVETRGKLQNPVTRSGGVLIGRVAASGAAVVSPPAIGTQIATLVSLTLTPLQLDDVGPVDPGSPQVPVRGRAFLPASAPWTVIPGDLPLDVVLTVLDTYGAASHVRALARPGDGVLILGAGRAGMLAAAAASDAVGPSGHVCVVDRDPHRVERALALGVAGHAVTTDLTRPLDARLAVERTGLAPADLTIVVVDAAGCEGSAILLTRPEGTIVFFSMATSFTAAALGAEGFGATARMLIGSGYAPDRGAYALDLVRARPGLIEAGRSS